MWRLPPKSLAGLVLLGFVLLFAPLVAYVARAIWQVDRLSGHAEQLLVDGVELTRDTSLLRQQVVEQERTARQYAVLHDPVLLELYRQRQRRLVAILNAVASRDPNPRTAALLAVMRQEFLHLHAVLTLDSENPNEVRTSPAEQSAALRIGFSRLGALTSELRWRANRNLNDGLSQLRDRVSSTRTEFFWQSIFLLPLVAVLTLGLLGRITRPVKELGVAIRSLGESGAPQSAIEIEAPSELDGLGRDLEWLRLRLAYIEVQKTRFVQHMSHELKTPLASIREGVELLLDGTTGTLHSRQREVVGIVHGSCLELHQLIESLLCMGAAVDQRAGLNRQSFSPGGLLESVLRRHRLEIERKQIEVRIGVDDCLVQADVEKIRTAVDNIISNAIKFSPERGIVDIKATTTRGALTIDVTDQGPGIDAVDHPRIFEPFYRGRKSIARGISGTGVGLAVALSCVELHHGDITLRSSTKNGSTFRLSLPALQA